MLRLPFAHSGESGAQPELSSGMSCTGWGTASSEQEADLPPGWTASTDPQTGKPYYYNAATQESSWRPPLIKPGTAKPARAAAAAANAPRDAPRDSASARRTQRETKPPSKPPAASNTGSSRDGKRVVLTPRTGAATTIQARSRGHLTRQSSPARDRSSSAVPGRGARSLSLEPTGPRDEDALARGMHAASDFISCLQANLRVPAQPLGKFKFEFDGDKALARLAGLAKAEALGGAGEPLTAEQLQARRSQPPQPQCKHTNPNPSRDPNPNPNPSPNPHQAARLAQAEATVPKGLGPLDRKLWGAFCVADLDGSGAISRKELAYAFRLAGLTSTTAEKRAVFREADLNRDGYG